MQQILNNKQLDLILSDEGYVVVPFLEMENVKTLIDFFYENHLTEIPGFYATAHSSDIQFRNKMNNKIKDVFANSINQFFNNCSALGGSYVVKSKLQEERLHPHQDWSIVDETKFRSFNIWVPLVDLNENNGSIRVIPRSHLWVDNYRGPNISDYFSKSNDKIWEHMQTLNMKAGEALIYDHRLFHASFPNKTDQLRVATVFGMIPNEAQMFYYFGDKEAVDVYESSVEFFMEGNIQKGPEVLKKVKRISEPLVNVKKLPSFIVNNSVNNDITQALKFDYNFISWVKKIFK
jgi:hypothetical protein